MSTARRPWMPPPTINEIRTLNRHSFLHDPNVATQIETISYMCFEAVSRTSEENNRLLPRLGYYRFRHFVINSAREFFIIGDVFLMWRNDDLWIMNPDDVHVVQHRENGPGPGLAYFLNTFTTLSGQMPITSRFRQQETRTRIENVFHLSRRLSSYGMLGSSIMMRYAEDPAVFEIPNIGHEIYVSQFVDAWVNSNIMLS